METDSISKFKPACPAMLEKVRRTCEPVLVTRGGRYCCVNVGDSRAYLLHDEVLRQISKDHTLVQERVDAGLITAEEATRQPDRNVLTRAIGTTAEVEPHLAEHAVLPGRIRTHLR